MHAVLQTYKNKDLASVVSSCSSTPPCLGLPDHPMIHIHDTQLQIHPNLLLHLSFVLAEMRIESIHCAIVHGTQSSPMFLTCTQLAPLHIAVSLHSRSTSSHIATGPWSVVDVTYKMTILSTGMRASAVMRQWCQALNLWDLHPTTGFSDITANEEMADDSIVEVLRKKKKV